MSAKTIEAPSLHAEPLTIELEPPATEPAFPRHPPRPPALDPATARHAPLAPTVAAAGPAPGRPHAVTPPRANADRPTRKMGAESLCLHL